MHTLSPIVESPPMIARGDFTKGRYCTKMASSLAAVLTIGSLMLTAAAAAKTFRIPYDRPIATLEISDFWRPVADSNGVEGAVFEGAVHLTVQFIPAPDVDKAAEAAIQQLSNRGVAVDPGTRRTANRDFNRSAAFKIDFSGTDPNGESDITLILIAAPRNRGFVSIGYWGDDEAEETVSNEIQSMADSVEFGQ